MAKQFVPEPPDYPDALLYLRDLFQELAMGLEQNGMAPATVTWLSLQAWQQEMLIDDLETWEKRVLVTLGVMRSNIQSEKLEHDRKSAKDKAPPRR